jgi:hypothetical protein
MAAVASATQYTVGGDNGWAVPGAGAESYNTWAEKTGFQIGDQLRKHSRSKPPHFISVVSLHLHFMMRF